VKRPDVRARPTSGRVAPVRALLIVALLAAEASAAVPEKAAKPERPASAPAKAPAKRAEKPWSKDGRIVLVAIHGTIDLGLAPFVERIVEQARAGDTLVLDVDTFGGRVDAAVRIRDALLGTQARVVAFINRRAISAGALISLSSDVIAMTPGATIGAATPVQMGSPEEGMKPVEEKVVSYMRKEMKATAEAKGRRGDLAEAMVDGDVEIEGINKKGKVLTLTTEEAKQYGIADHVVGSLDELLAAIGLPGRKVERPAITWAERVARFLTDPTVSSLLMTLGFLGILIELYTGGHGIALVLSLVFLGLFFFGHLVVKLAGWEELGLFLLGAGLLGVEIFVLPGFGVAGVLGIVLMLVALVMALVEAPRMPFDVYWSLGDLLSAMARVMGVVIVTALLGLGIGRWAPRTGLGRRLLLAQQSAPGHSLPDAAAPSLVGREGVADTNLRPAGKAVLDGRRYDVVTQGEYIERGAAIRIVAVEGTRIVVRPA
jgi:membrane-bound serine protease (ClpP class)